MKDRFPVQIQEVKEGTGSVSGKTLPDPESGILKYELL